MTEKINWQSDKLSVSNNAALIIPAAPKPSGYWVLYDNAPHKIRFYVYHRPTDEQIKNTEQLLGWKWEEAV